MSRVLSYTQRRSSEPDYSNEEERYELARMLFLEANLDSTDPLECVVEASWAAGFHGFDEACLRLLSEFVGFFPVRVVTENGVIAVHLGDAETALQSPDDNADFWESDELVKEAARIAPEQWRIEEAKMQKARQKYFDLNGSWANPD